MNYRGHKVIHHGGNVDGFSTMVSLLPEEKVGVVVLSNHHPSAIRDVVPYVVFDKVLGLDPLPWGERYDDLYKSMLGGMKQAAAHKATKAASAPSTHALEDHVGRYFHPGYSNFDITLEDGKLKPHFNDLDLSMEHVHYDVWGLQLPIPESPPIDLAFETGFDGGITALRIPLESTVDPIVFKREADTGLADREVLARYLGTFELGPIKVTVDIDKQDRLTLFVPGQGTAVLRPKRERIFDVPEQPALTVEFLLAGDGAVEKMVVEPVGIFTPVSKE
jgi:hypothetical protein